MLGAARAILALVLAWLPWTYGGVTATGEALLLGGAALAAAAAALARLGVDGRPIRVVAGGRPAQVALGAAAVGLGWAALACLPLPPGVLAWCSPGSLAWRAPVPPGAPAGWVPIALAPDASASAVWRAAAVVVLAAVARLVIRRSGDALWILGPIAVSGSLCALYGVAGVLSGGVLTAWHAAGGATRAHAPFVNPNHLATACAITLPCLAALLGWHRRGTRLPRGAMALRVVGVGAVLVTLAALVATASRGGVLATMGGLAVFGWLARPSEAVDAPAGRWRVAVPLAVGAVVFVVAFGLEPLLARFADVGSDGVSRVAGWRLALAVFADFPVCGAGAGSFEGLSRAYQPADVTGTWDAAHNDWLDLAARTGVVGFAAALTVLGAVLVGCWRVRGAGVRTARRMAVAAGAGAVSAVAWHAVVDFPLQIPALATWAGVLAAAALAAADTSAAREQLRGGGAA